jgi:hypothetical protein
MNEQTAGPATPMPKRKHRPWTYPPGVHLAVRTETGYRPAMVIQDNGEAEPMVKVRCAVKGVVQDRWVYRRDLIPPPWVRPGRRRR